MTTLDKPVASSRLGHFSQDILKVADAMYSQKEQQDLGFCYTSVCYTRELV